MIRKSGSHPTLHWRELDSNLRFRARAVRSRKVCAAGRSRSGLFRQLILPLSGRPDRGRNAAGGRRGNGRSWSGRTRAPYAQAGASGWLPRRWRPVLTPDEAHLTLSVAAQIRRASKEITLRSEPAEALLARPNLSLIKLIVRAHLFKATLLRHGANSKFADLAQHQKLNRSYYSRVLRLAYLAGQPGHPEDQSSEEIHHLKQFLSAGIGSRIRTVGPTA
jgi:hypothetical protein